jgi:carboxyl-terminal processing protease
LRYAREMLASLGDSYTRLLEPVEVADKKERRHNPDPESVFARMLPNGVGYIRIMDFDPVSIVDDVAKELAKIAECTSLVVDLRDNGGGLIDEAANCLEMFVAEGPIAAIDWQEEEGTKRRDVYFSPDAFVVLTTSPNGEENWEGFIRRSPIVAGRPTVVLINDGTASAAELFAAAVLHNGKESGDCVAIGSRTRGKGIAQCDFAILGKVTVKISCKRFLSPADVWFGDAQSDCHGIDADILLADDSTKAALTAAVDYLGRARERQVA